MSVRERLTLLGKGYADSVVEKVKQLIDIAKVVARKVKLQRVGKEHKGLCPFHEEAVPSFYVNSEKGFYHCFGCGAHGDAVKFLQDSMQITLPEAIEMLIRENKIKVETFSPNIELN